MFDVDQYEAFAISQSHLGNEVHELRFALATASTDQFFVQE